MKKNNFTKISIEITIAFLVIAITFFFLHFISFRLASYFKTKDFRNALEHSVSARANSYSGRFTYLVQDLNRSFLVSEKNSNEQFAAASLIKIPLLVAAFFAAQEGAFSLNDAVTISKRDITGGSGVLKSTKLPKKITVEELLEIMITRSDNTAANKLIDMLGFTYINDLFKKLQLTQTVLSRKILDLRSRKKGVENLISCRDLAYLLSKIYRKEMVSKNASEMMLGFLMNQKVNDRIPKYLPDDIGVAHKTGLEKTVVGDAGIVFSHNNDYVICVLTSGFSDYKTAKDFIAKISLDVYNSFDTLL